MAPEAVARVREGDPRRLRHRLAGDLDNIVMTALAKDRVRRYGSAEQLGEDVRRHLEGLPVRARKATLAYRAGKFVRRHGWGVAVVTVAVAALVAFGVTMAVERNRTAVERDRAQEVTEFLVDVFHLSEPSATKGKTVTVQDVLAQGAGRVDAELAGQPLTRATLKDAIGRAYNNLGLYDQARPLLAEALRLREEVLGPDHPDVAASEDHLGLVLRDLGEVAEAERLGRLAVATLEKHRADPGGETLYAQGLHNLAAALNQAGKYDEAEALYRQALEIKRRLLEGHANADLAYTLNSFGTLLWNRGRSGEAEPLLREALAVRRTVYGEVHPEVSTSLNNLASLLVERGDAAQARPLYEEDLALRRQLYGPDHPRVAFVLNNLALLDQEQGDLAAAEPRLREALAIFGKAVGAAHPNYAVARRNLAALLAAKGEPAACEGEARPAVETLRQALPAGHWRIADAESVLGGCLTGLGRFDEAEPLLVGGYEAVRKVQPDSSYTRDARARLVALYLAWGKPEQAARWRAEGEAAAAPPVSTSKSAG